jgi:CRISPR-associated protein Csx14
MSEREPIRVRVDVRNPGQFFACCGLFELADRMWPGVEAWFEEGEFVISGGGTLHDLLQEIATLDLMQLDREDDTSSPALLRSPRMRELRLDWWWDEASGGRDLKVWAGTMESVRIGRAMRHALRDTTLWNAGLFDVGMIVYDPEDNSKKVEPYYFDARRAPNAHSRDVGFSANDLSLTTTAFPAVELLCLVGLQRFRPKRMGRTRAYRYTVWRTPLPMVAASATVPGFVANVGITFEFENWYRTGQKKHKAFRPAIALSHEETD